MHLSVVNAPNHTSFNKVLLLFPAKALFKAVLRQLKLRRGKDFNEQLHSFVQKNKEPDFNPEDPELLRKLEENRKLWRDEQQVEIRMF